jgi:cytochrome c oxidase subunit 2
MRANAWQSCLIVDQNLEEHVAGEMMKAPPPSKHNHPSRLLKILSGGFMLVAAAALAGCASASSVFRPASINASQISRLTLAVYLIAAGVFIVVEGFLVFAAIRFRRKPSQTLPNQIEGNRTLELAWTAAPAIVLAVVFVISLKTLGFVTTQPANAAQAGSSADPPLHIRVVGHQWWWEFDYPDLGIITANEFHVPVNTFVNLDIESVDVVHSYWAPELGGKIDAIPGHTNHTWFEATKTGQYHGQCAEFCGLQHANMRFTAFVESADQFQAWVKDQQAAIPTASGLAAQGEDLFTTGACIGCHTIDGTNAKGTLGPNLTHFASRGTFAGGMVANTPENLSSWLADPQVLKPGNDMPNLKLTPDQINALVAFLESLK